jgi:hypothetical protein
MYRDTVRNWVSTLESQYPRNGRPVAQLACVGGSDEHWQVWLNSETFTRGAPPDGVLLPIEGSPDLYTCEWHPDSTDIESSN